MTKIRDIRVIGIDGLFFIGVLNYEQLASSMKENMYSVYGMDVEAGARTKQMFP